MSESESPAWREFFGFAEAYDLTYTDEDEDEQVAHTTSWGLSWRALGALIMTHSDDQGLVLPPTIAPEQVVVVPIWQEDTKDEVLEYAEALAADLEAEGVRVELDARDERNPGFKFNEWELRGVPLRFEIGPNEVADGEITAVHRPDGESVTLDRDDVTETIHDQFDEVFAKLYAAAEENLAENVREADSRNEILGTIGQHGGYVKTGWCGDEACEAEIKDTIHAEIVLVPFEEDEVGRAASDVDAGFLPEPDHDGKDCAICGDEATETAFFAKSY